MPADTKRGAWLAQLQRFDEPRNPVMPGYRQPILPMPPTRRQRRQEAITWALLVVGLLLVGGGTAAIVWLLRAAWLATEHVIH
jgi:hypothetical protein